MLTLADRFYENISIEPNSGCWLWLGSLNAANYGRIARNKGEGHAMATHVSKELAGEPRPFDTALALHRCDNSFCVNPDHLYWGTHQQNADDKVRRRRHHLHSRNTCARGHEYTEENTLFMASRNKRICRKCSRARGMKYYYKRVAGGALCHS